MHRDGLHFRGVSCCQMAEQSLMVGALMPSLTFVIQMCLHLQVIELSREQERTKQKEAETKAAEMKAAAAQYSIVNTPPPPPRRMAD